MEIFSKIAEQRIREAIERGDFDRLENRGRPLSLDEDLWVPEDLRSAYRVLKNAGCLPPELELRKEVLNLRELIDTLDDDKERLGKIRELNFKLMKLGEMRRRPVNLEQFPLYEDKLYRKLTE
jgi:hypothetical protein